MVMALEGKTKILTPMEGETDLWLVSSKDDITAGDGAKRDVFLGKGALVNKITCDVFERLKHHGVPLAYVQQQGDSFVTKWADMFPVEVVVRNEAFGSYCKRNPEVASRTVFKEPIVEFFFKTSNRNFFGLQLECDDPLMVFSDDGVRLSLHHPSRPIDHERPMVEVAHVQMSVATRRQLYEDMKTCRHLALQVNMHLKAAWQQQGGTLVDFKIECGRQSGLTVVADVIDFDSWRVMLGDKPLSKQIYRDGGSDEDVMSAMRLTAKITGGFKY